MLKTLSILTALFIVLAVVCRFAIPSDVYLRWPLASTYRPGNEMVFRIFVIAAVAVGLIALAKLALEHIR